MHEREKPGALAGRQVCQERNLEIKICGGWQIAGRAGLAFPAKVIHGGYSSSLLFVREIESFDIWYNICLAASHNAYGPVCLKEHLKTWLLCKITLK